MQNKHFLKILEICFHNIEQFISDTYVQKKSVGCQYLDMSSTRLMLDQDPIAPSEPLFKKTGMDEY